MLVGGREETDRIANWARIQKKPLLPIVRFGGAAAQIYTDERDAFEKKYAGAISKEQFEDLAEAASPYPEFCRTLISVAERISRLAFAIMSFDPRHEATYDAIRRACREAGYECRKISEEHDIQRISPAIRDRIGACAFAIVDITARSPNVYYELGYAEGLKQKFIVTAKDGTKRPFDISDLQVLFWKDTNDLVDKLRSRIEELYPVTAAH